MVNRINDESVDIVIYLYRGLSELESKEDVLDFLYGSPDIDISALVDLMITKTIGDNIVYASEASETIDGLYGYAYIVDFGDAIAQVLSTNVSLETAEAIQPTLIQIVETLTYEPLVVTPFSEFEEVEIDTSRATETYDFRVSNYIFDVPEHWFINNDDLYEAYNGNDFYDQYGSEINVSIFKNYLDRNYLTSDERIEQRVRVFTNDAFTFEADTTDLTLINMSGKKVVMIKWTQGEQFGAIIEIWLDDIAQAVIWMSTDITNPIDEITADLLAVSASLRLDMQESEDLSLDTSTLTESYTYPSETGDITIHLPEGWEITREAEYILTSNFDVDDLNSYAQNEVKISIYPISIYDYPQNQDFIELFLWLEENSPTHTFFDYAKPYRGNGVSFMFLVSRIESILESSRMIIFQPENNLIILVDAMTAYQIEQFNEIVWTVGTAIEFEPYPLPDDA